jgi:hypothetical protein
VAGVLALQKDEEASQEIDQVHGHDNEPDDPYNPALGQDAQQRNGESGLAEGASHDSQHLGNVCEQADVDDILRILGSNSLNMPAKSLLCC